MSKKNLTKLSARRQPPPDQITQFVHGGPGKDGETQRSSQMERQTSAEKKMARLTVDLARSAQRWFKLGVCVRADTKMNVELRRMIERRIAELELQYTSK